MIMLYPHIVKKVDIFTSYVLIAKTHRKRKKYWLYALELSLHAFIEVKTFIFSSSGPSAEFIDSEKLVKDAGLSEVTFFRCLSTFG